MHSRSYVVILPLLLITAGCGTTTLNLRSTDYVVDLTQYKSLTIQTSTTQGATVPEATQARMKGLIKDEILECCRGRFENISLGDPGADDLILNVKFTIYEEGNRLAALCWPAWARCRYMRKSRLRILTPGRLSTEEKQARRLLGVEFTERLQA